MKLTQAVREILQKLHSAGFEAYVVGGAVRSHALGSEISDYDITTQASPEEIFGVFCDYNTFAPGLKHGTVCVERDKTVYEITTFRTEGGYTDSRHPDEVRFVRNLHEDLSRRDFTINAMCFDGQRFVDEFGGMEDCKNKIIRAIGNPVERFEEDALRILRALRFASRLGFEIETETKNAIFARYTLLSNVSRERIATELNGILTGEHCLGVLLGYSEVIAFILPELKACIGFEQKSRYHAYDVYTHSAVACSLMPPVAELRLAALLHDCGKPDCFTVDENGEGHFYGHAKKSAIFAQKAVDSLKYSNAFKKRVVDIVALHDYPIVPNGWQGEAKYVMRALNKLGEALLRDLIEIKRADNSSKQPHVKDRLVLLDRVTVVLDELLSQNPCFTLKSLCIDGSRLIELGLSGKQVGDALNGALNAVIEGTVQNEGQALEQFIISNYVEKAKE